MGNLKLKNEEYDALLRSDLCGFIERSFLELNPQTKYYPNWHIEVMAAKLEAWRKGQNNRLIMNVPPRSLKSHCASIALPAWILGHSPSAQIICVSYAQDLADKMARDCRTLMQSRFYQRLFPTRLSWQKQSVAEFVTTAGGGRLSTSTGGVLTGRGADFIIIDDPIKPADALSEPVRRAANEWYSNTLVTRLNDKRTGRILLIMQRLHQDDLVGHVLGLEEWEVLAFPAVAQTAETFIVTNIIGKRRAFSRKQGDALHPEREPLSILEQIRRSVGEYNFNSQYQQAPTPIEGNLVKRSWFRMYRDGEQPGSFEQVIQSWDTANKATELSDYSVCTTWGLKNKQIYLLDVYRKRLAYPELKRAVRAQAERHRPGVVLIEDKASGTQLIQELLRDGLRMVKPITPDLDKVMRFNAQTATIENGFVHIPAMAAWLDEYLNELTAFPGSKHDDQADSTAQALAWINSAPPEPGALTYLRYECARVAVQNGMSLEAAAARSEITPEELRTSIANYEQAKQKWRKSREPEFAEICLYCGQGIPFGMNYTSHGCDPYHNECYKKKFG